MNNPKIYCIVGPTGSGKTGFAIKLAKRLNGEVVSCDSMQIYKYMDIGTAKPTFEEMDGVVHHMIDFVEPSCDFNVADFVKKARCTIDDILLRGKTPILCGGTGLYIDSIINQIEFSEDKRDEEYRNMLVEKAEREGNEAVHKVLAEKDPQEAEKVHPNNIKRVIRALEIIKTTGMTKTEADILAKGKPLYNAEIYGMLWDREVLYERINLRVDLMMKEGLLEEVKKIMAMNLPENCTALQAIGYKELIRFLRGKCSLEEAIEDIKRESRRYAKRQITWFKRNDKIKWINPSESEF